MIRTFEYIVIDPIARSASGKTAVYEVTNRRSGDILGHIRWFGRWRQYVFHPVAQTVYSKGCLRDIADFIQDAR